jgi:hypothetical protein
MKRVNFLWMTGLYPFPRYDSPPSPTPGAGADDGLAIEPRRSNMPITTPDTYPPVMQSIIDHWTAVNTAISPTVLTLKGGYALADFTADRTGISDSLDAVIVSDNGRQAAKTDLDTQKSAIRARLSQFRAMVRAQLSSTRYTAMLPTLPVATAAEGAYTKPFTDAANIWQQINTDTIPGFTGPLLLAGGYTLATFNTDLTALRAAWIAYTVALNNASGTRADRDILLAPARQRMVQYRLAAKGILPAGSAQLATIPTLSSNTGPAAQPVNPSIVWDPVAEKAVITFAASASTDVSEYALRTAPGPTYKTKDESTVTSVGPDVLTFSTDAGLAAPGAAALFRVYTRTTTGREAGSITLKLTRPDV